MAHRRLLLPLDMQATARSVVDDVAPFPIDVLFADAEGTVDALAVLPYSVERQRGYIGRFVIKGFTQNKPPQAVTIHFDALGVGEDQTMGTISIDHDTQA